LLGLVLITAGFFAGHAVASSAVGRTATHGRAQASALYQSAYYVGSSVGSTVGALAFHSGGWAGTVGVGLVAVAGVGAITLLGTRAARVEHRLAKAACLPRPPRHDHALTCVFSRSAGRCQWAAVASEVLDATTHHGQATGAGGR